MKFISNIFYFFIYILQLINFFSLQLYFFGLSLTLRNILIVNYLTSFEGKSNFNDIFKRVRDGVSLIRLVLMKNVPELLTEQV